MRHLLSLAALVSLIPTCLSLPSLRASANPYLDADAVVVKSYASQFEAVVQHFVNAGDEVNAARARTAQNTPNFKWISNTAHIASIKPLIEDAIDLQKETGRKALVQLVIYNLPDRDCASKVSLGEFKLADGGYTKYTKFIDAIAAELSTLEATSTQFVVVLEPDSLANLITNLHEPKCAGAAEEYTNGIAYAIAKLSKPNVTLYLDAAHGGWLGWPANLRPTAQLLRTVLSLSKSSNPSANIRGLALNVAHYNQLVAPLRENFTQWNDAWDESRYATLLVPHLKEAGVPAHFIVDQSRSGRAGIRTAWWQGCNLKNAGFGPRPSADQRVIGNADVDAVVWIKPGGVSDGTSDVESPGYKEECASEVSHVPAPEEGEWFNEYAVGLVLNANPPLPPLA